MTYSVFEVRAAQLGKCLRSINVGPEVPAGVCLERSFDYVVAALAASKAGGAYLPLDPTWPPVGFGVLTPPELELESA